MLRQWHRPLLVSSALLVGLMLVCGIGLLVDDRELLGESVWFKPLKFSFAFAAYGATLAWLLTKLPRARRLGWWAGTVLAVFAVIEIGLIVVLAARGTFSHFSYADPDPVAGVLVAILNPGVAGVLVSNLVIAIMVLVQRTGDRALTMGLRAGLALSTIGTFLPLWLSNANGADTRTVTNANGDKVTMAGSHGIGDPDGTGMPITNWSTTGGDLRVPHFVGMHGIHVLVLITIVVGALGARHGWLRAEKVRARLVGVAGLGYFGLLAILTWQARRGQSLIHPDEQTLLAFAGVVLVTVAAAVAVISSARRQPAELPSPVP